MALIDPGKPVHKCRPPKVETDRQYWDVDGGGYIAEPQPENGNNKITKVYPGATWECDVCKHRFTLSKRLEWMGMFAFSQQTWWDQKLGDIGKGFLKTDV